jgi:hypothetical protein
MGKVAIYIDEAVWKSLKEEVLRKYGTIESLIESYLVRDAVIKCLNNLSETYGFIASGKVKEDRPESKISAGEVLRGMRDERAGLS